MTKELDKNECESIFCRYCNKVLSQQKGEYAHGCLDCHGDPRAEKLFWKDKEIKKLKSEIESLKAENEKLRNVLEEIANEDFRGNRSSGSVKAFNTLKKLNKERE